MVLKELEFDFSYPNSPQPNGECPRNCGSVQEGEQGVQMHKSTLLGNEDFHLNKINKHEKLHDVFVPSSCPAREFGLDVFARKSMFFFSVRFSMTFSRFRTRKAINF